MKSATLLVLTLLAGAFVFAGCVSDSGTKSDGADARSAKRIRGAGGFAGEAYGGSVDFNRTAAPDFDFSKVIVADHGVPGGHAIRALHSGSKGLELVGYDPLVQGKDPTAYTSGFCAIDVWGDGEHFYAAVTHFAGNGGATIVDITDPTKPRVLSHIDSGMVNSDTQFTDDGKYLFLGAYLGVNTPLGQLRESLRQVPLAGAYDVLANGVSVWDVTDKANPKYMFFSETGTYHNLFTVTINETYYLLQTYSNSVYRFDPSGGGKLVEVSKTSTMVHDMTVARHPITGDWMLYTGKGRGMAIINFNDPEHPVELSEVIPKTEPNNPRYWHEQEAMHHLVDGRALVIAAGERGDGASEPYAVIDVTDPYNPFEVGMWDLPGKPNSPAPNFFTFSPHEIGTWNGYVTVANYHAGVWLWDVGNAERMANPVTVGYYFADKEPAMYGAPQNPPFAFNPDHWGAYFDDRGYVITADWGSGLYVLKFAATGTWTPPTPISHN